MDMVSVCSVENTFLYISPSVERVLGYRPEELIGATVSEFVHPDDLAGYGQRIIEEIQTASGPSGPFGPIEARYRHKDGSWRHLETTMNVLVDDPDVGGIVCVSRDVTERRYLEEKIRLLNKSLEERVAERTTQLESTTRKMAEGEERYRAVVEQAADGILLVDVDSKRVLEANAVYQNLLGYAPEEILRLTLYDLVPYPREAMDCYVGRVLEQKSYVSGERRHRRKDGSLVDVEVSANVISYSGEETLCIVVRDITERKRAAETLREMRESERRRMARDLHDGALQDLTYALAEAQIIQALSEDVKLEERLSQQLEALRRAGRGLRSAVYDLRLEEERDRPFPALLEALVTQNREMAPHCDLRLAVDGGFPQEPLGETGTELLRIIQEALSNVRRHSGAKNVLVTVWLEGGDLVAEVSDDGRGFQPGSGTGVGLKSMRERVTAIGGELNVRSEPGKGTRVRLRASMPALLRQTPESTSE